MMAKDSDRKRKLEQDQVEQTTTPKRLKPSKADSASKAASNTNGNHSPKVIISKTEDRQASQAVGESAKRDRKDKSAVDGNLQDDRYPEVQQVVSESTARDGDSKSRSRKSHQLEGAIQNEIVVKDSEDVSQSIGNVPENQVGLVKDKAQRKREKKERRRAEKEAIAQQQAVIEPQLKSVTVKSHKGWSLSIPTGGRYLDQDPFFVEDENDNKCLVAATSREVQLISLETSLAVRTHIVPDGCGITCYTTSPNHPQCIDIAYDNGSKVQWNFTTSTVVKGTFPGREVATAMSPTILADDRAETFYITGSRGDWTIVGERRSLYTTQRQLKSIQVLHNGAYIVCLSPSALILGARKDTSQASDYTWVEIPFEMPITCAASRLVFDRPDKKKQSNRPDLAVAVGNAEGQIHLYSSLALLFASSSQGEVASPRILHWHREAVSAIKFSRDANYLISGGKETVLVIWQLDTGKKQFLPHLTAEIERIVVSPDGTRYALQMGDNSIMVLSTSELKPVANVAGLQLPVLTDQLDAQGVVLPGVATTVHPKDPHQLLLSVPSTQPKARTDTATRPFLQAFDTRNSRHISRQALTRNNITDFNDGPEGTPISPPDVSQLAVSADGKWLASVDEWVVPATDLKHEVVRSDGLSVEELAEVQEQQERRREVYLKFWRWDDKQEIWTLSTRADAPHRRFVNADVGTGAGRVLKVVSDPASNCFATIGEDSIVKIWRPKMRTRHGIPLKEQDGTDAVDWTCKHTALLPIAPEGPDRADSPMEIAEEQEKSHALAGACLAFSHDGSMLACGQMIGSETAAPVIHFVSTATGSILTSKSGLVVPGSEVVDIAFLDRYLITLSTSAIRLWNLIDDAHHYTINLLGNLEEQQEAMLAVNHAENTYAIVSYAPKKGTDELAIKINVHEARTPETLFEADLDVRPVALLGGNGTKGFTIVFEDGTIRSLTSATSTTTRSALLDTTKDTLRPASALAAPEQDVEMADTLALPSAGDFTSAGADMMDEDDRPVVRPEHLAAVFDTGSSLALPPLRDMFSSVVDLFARKPRRYAADEDADAMEVEA